MTDKNPQAHSPGSANPAGKIATARANHVTTITLDNPARRNALTLAMWQQLIVALDTAETDAETRCIVVRGAGGKAFCSGADISEFGEHRASPAAVEAYNHTAEAAMNRLHQVNKPTIAMIEGFCVGGGMALAVSCDIRIAAASARFAIPAAKLGLGYDFAGISRLIDIVGASRTKEIFFTARLYDAAEVDAMNFLNALVADDKLVETVAGYASKIAANAPMTIASVKLAVANALADPDKRDLAACLAAELACFQSQDYQEGRRAFAEKRQPVFEGR